MIQKTNARSGSTSVGPTRQGADGPESWGQWSGRRHYTLEVVQNPLRARMCGFGDKDRRPLAPAAVVKMIVQREDNTFIDVDEVDCSFFLVTVDLWSSDGKHEMNLVLHPTSADRYVPASSSKVKRRGTNASQAAQRSGRQSPTPTAPTPSSSSFPQSSGMTSFISPSSPAYSGQSYPFPNTSESNSFQPIAPYGSSSEPNAPTWGYPSSAVDRPSQYNQPVLPGSAQPLGKETASPSVGFNRGTTTTTSDNWHVETPVEDHRDYSRWPADPAYPPLDDSSPVTPGPPPSIDPALRSQSATSPSWSSAPLTASIASDAYPQNRFSAESYGPNAPQQQPGSQPQAQQPQTQTQTQTQTQPPQTSTTAQQSDTSMYASASYAQQVHQQQQQTPYNQGPFVQDTPPSTIPPLPRHTYTRTLVGPLSANACRLLDEHRKPGIFFLFQDLSIRTEGTFRLRLRLMNIGAPPAPESGAVRVHTSVSPILAQTFTDPFIVYSAKRFPGVPDTTALSIALGNQGQKLPLRNRNGANKQGRKRRHSGSDASGDESE